MDKIYNTVKVIQNDKTNFRDENKKADLCVPFLQMIFF